MATATEHIYAAQIDRYRDHLAQLRAQVVKEQYLPLSRKHMIASDLNLVDDILNILSRHLRQ